MKLYLFFHCFFLYLPFISVAQENFSVTLKQISINGVPSVHSGSFAQHQGKWIFIGGRKNGLHGFQPPMAFPSSGINDSIYVVDPVTGQSWSAHTGALSEDIREAITSSNMQFYHQDSMLYMIGGYGWKNSVNDFRTFATLTAVNLNGLTAAVTGAQSVIPYFRQVVDSNLAVCGGNLEKLDSVYYLVFGHQFDGWYDRTDTTGFFVQKYSHEIRKFGIEDDGISLSVINYSASNDTANFRRRDFNLVPQFFPDRSLGLTAFTGVFRKNINLPHLNTVNITPSGYSVINNFNQNLSQYQCAVMPVYDSLGNAMHTVFFGGISMYTLDTLAQSLVVDSLVPFVTTISKVSRYADSTMKEFKLPVEMPALLGTNAVFIPDPSVKVKHNSIVELNKLSGKSRAGFLIGGIESPMPNVGADDDPALSNASAYIFEVWIEKDGNAVRELEFSSSLLDFIIYPNPVRDETVISFYLTKREAVKIILLDAKGSFVKIITEEELEAGAHRFMFRSEGIAAGNYFCRIAAGNESRTIKVVVRGDKGVRLR